MRHVILSLLLACFSNSLFSQSAALSGKITNEAGKGLPGAVVVLEGTSSGALSDDDGSYRMEGFPSGNYEVLFSYPGMKTERITLFIEGETEYSPVMKVENPAALPSEANPSERLLKLNEAMVYTVGKVPENGVFANSALSREDIKPLDNGQDMPYLLRFTPSLVTTSDAGAGIGYTGMRIRGSDQSRINVTINGIPYNDPESQGVFWVNLPDFAGSTDQISIQRGVGSSTNGAGAFGATLGLNTLSFDDAPYAEISNTYGSFNTFRHRVAFGTGMMANGFAIEGRLSQVTSDGYVDRAASELRSYYLAGRYQGESYTIDALVFGGKERTYQSWWGVPEVALDGNETDIREWGVNNGYSDRQVDDLVNLGRRANYYTYENEVDDYAQDHYQLHFNKDLGKGFALQVAGHYTYGRGFFEQFRESDRLSSYGLEPIVFNAAQQFSDGFDSDGNPVNTGFESDYNWDPIEFTHTVVNDAGGNPITNEQDQVLLNSVAQITRSDVIRRRWLENDFYGTTYALTYDRKLEGGNQVNVILGGAWNAYDGDHFGEIIWMEHPNASDYGDFYYLNNGYKTDFNNYLKVNYLINNKISVYGDLQLRDVTYRVQGIDRDRIPLDITDSLRFFNPKFGVSAQVSERDQLYASYAVGNREPTRRDFVDAPQGVRPQHETMFDLEFGYRRTAESYAVSVNFYNMDYDNQLVLTGELNDVGSPIRTNVANSFRRGVELEAGVQITKQLSLNANATYSQNKIREFTEEVAAYDADFNFIGFEQNRFEETDISFAPEWIAGAIATYRFIDSDRHRAEVAWQSKYVGAQYLDNTSNADRQMPAYLVNDLRIGYALLNTGMRSLELNLLVNNILDERFVNNGYTYAFLFDGQRIDENFYYPQAGRNFLLSLTLGF